MVDHRVTHLNVGACWTLALGAETGSECEVCQHAFSQVQFLQTSNLCDVKLKQSSSHFCL